MKKLIASFIVTIFAATASFAQDAATKPNPNAADFKFEKEVYEFGSIKQGESVTYEFKFKNSGKEPLIITNASGSCGCTVPVWPKEPVKKGETGIIKVTFNSTGKMGAQDKTVTITSNAKTNPMVLHIKGNVEAAAATSEPADKK
jgi:hypothetical protein